jgi:hypothetical protein
VLAHLPVRFFGISTVERANKIRMPSQRQLAILADTVVAPVENQNKDSISIFVPASSDRAHIMDISSGMQLVHIPPDVNESLNRPPHQVGNLSMAYLENALNAVRPARDVHTEERAWNRACAEYDWLRVSRARLGGIRLPVPDEVSPLISGYEIFDASNFCNTTMNLCLPFKDEGKSLTWPIYLPFMSDMTD